MLLASKKRIEHSDPDAIKIVSNSTPMHGSVIQRKAPSGGLHGHVTIFTINPGQEVFSEKVTMLVPRFENSKIIGANFLKHVGDNQMLDEELPKLCLDLFKQDSYADSHFGTAACCLIAVDTPYDKLAGAFADQISKEPVFGLFMGCAMMRHCCNPNVELTLNTKGDGVAVRALRHIPRGVELTRDWVAEHYQHNRHNKSTNRGREATKRMNNLDLEKDMDANDGSMRMNELIGGLSYTERDKVHKEMFGCPCSCYWCVQCRANVGFKKSDDFVRKSINTTHFNTDMIDIGAIPDTKVSMLKAIIRLLEDAYINNQFCNVPVLSRAYVQLSAAQLMIGLNSEGSKALSVAAAYSVLCRGKAARETVQLAALLKKRHVESTSLDMLPIFQGQTFNLALEGIVPGSKTSLHTFNKLMATNVRRLDDLESQQEIVAKMLASGSTAGLIHPHHQHQHQHTGGDDGMSEVSSMHNSVDGYSDTLSVHSAMAPRSMVKVGRKVMHALHTRTVTRHHHTHSQEALNDTLEEDIVDKLRESPTNTVGGVSGMFFEKELIPPSKTAGHRRARTPKAVRDIGQPRRNEEKGAVDYERLSTSPTHRVSRTREGVSLYKFAGDPDDSDCMSDSLSLASSVITGSVTNMWGVRENDLNSFMTDMSTGSSTSGAKPKPAHLQKSDMKLYNNSSSNRSMVIVPPNKDVQRSLKKWRGAHVDIDSHPSMNPKGKYNNLLAKAFDVLDSPGADVDDCSLASTTSMQYSTASTSMGSSTINSKSKTKRRTKATYFQKKLLHQQLVDEVMAERMKKNNSPEKIDNPDTIEQLERDSDMRTIRNISSPQAMRDIPPTGGAGDGPTADHYFHPFGVQPKGFARRNVKTSERLQGAKSRRLPKVETPPHILRAFSYLATTSPAPKVPGISPASNDNSASFSPDGDSPVPSAQETVSTDSVGEDPTSPMAENSNSVPADSPAPTKVDIVPLPPLDDAGEDEDEDEDEAGDAF